MCSWTAVPSRAGVELGGSEARARFQSAPQRARSVALASGDFRRGFGVHHPALNQGTADDRWGGVASSCGEAPKISGIQVDGGSEFKSIFEEEYQKRGLELFVLPPKRPDLNGCVERAPSTWRYEFYAVYDLPNKIEKLQACVDQFADHFNTERPHHALAGLTPAEYLERDGLA